MRVSSNVSYVNALEDSIDNIMSTFGIIVALNYFVCSELSVFNGTKFLKNLSNNNEYFFGVVCSLLYNYYIHLTANNFCFLYFKIYLSTFHCSVQDVDYNVFQDIKFLCLF